MEYEVLLYTKSYKDNKGNKFFKYLCKFNDKTLEVNLSNTCKANLNASMVQYSFAYPVKVKFKSSQYFIKNESYIRNDKTKGSKDVVVLLDFETIAQGNFPAGKTLDDITQN